jgi:DNA integrity scanning protein DisA with diadenylate cyclase activity
VPDIQHAELAKRLRDVFPEARPADLEHLTRLVLSFSHINHGALLVVTENAAAEAERLAAQAIGVDPTVLDEHILAGIGRIDGAVLIDPTGRVHAFGAILDGKVKRESRGNTSRGARYNSARRYVEDQTCRCMALVISEDGMIDFLAGKGDQGGAYSTITRAIR